MCRINRWGGMLNHLSMAYLLSNNCTKNYWIGQLLKLSLVGFTDVSWTITFPDRRFPDKTFPGQDLSRTITFPDKTFPGKTFPRQDVSRTRRFPVNHFPGQTFSGQTFPGQVILRNFLYTVCVNTSSIVLVTRYVGIRSVYYWCVLVGMQ